MSTETSPEKTKVSPMMKPAIGAVAAFAIDTYGFGSQDQQASMLLGAGVGVSFFLAPYISNALPFESTLSSIGTDNGISAEARLVECLLGIGSTFVIEEYILNNGFHTDDLSRKIMCIVGADLIATYATAYINGEALVYIKGTGL